MATIRKSFSHGRTRQAVMECEANRKRGLKPTTSPAQKRMTPEEEQAFLAAFKQRQAETDAYINSPEVIEYCRKADEKEKRKEERQLARETKREAEREERRRNPKSPIDAYYNHMESCPPYLLDPKEHRTWKKANPTFEFNGVTYRAHWIPQLTNSGKNTRWMGYLTVRMAAGSLSRTITSTIAATIPSATGDFRNESGSQAYEPTSAPAAASAGDPHRHDDQ